MSENSVLFKKFHPGSQFEWERISSIVQLRPSQRESEAEPTTSSRYSSFRVHERSLDPRRLRKAARQSGTNKQTSAYVDLQPLGLTAGEEKSDSPFVSTLHPPSRIGTNIQVFQEASGFQIRHTQTPVAGTVDADQSTDHRPSASPQLIGEFRLILSLSCIYGRGRFHYEGSTTLRKIVRDKEYSLALKISVFTILLL